MLKSLVLSGLLMAGFVQADQTCARRGCPVAAHFASVSDSRSYGLLIAAPESGCRRVRFRVEGKGAYLGQTPPLGPGELAVVRIGRGFPEGRVDVTIDAIGCDQPPAAMRRVTLSKIAPDHGWRASRSLALR
jgi:hypothetical protein